MKGRLYKAEMARAQAFIVALFVSFAWSGIGNRSLAAIRAISGINVLFCAYNKNG